MTLRLCLVQGAALAVALWLAAAQAGGGPAEPEPDGFRWRMPAWAPAPRVPEDNPMTAAKVELGRRLFYDARLSSDGTIACASCHLQALAFTDGQVVTEGVHGVVGRRNAPSLANVGYLPTLTWANPHLDRLEVQALIPLFGTDPEEMGLAGREGRLFAALAADPWYARAFAAAFPERPEPDLATITRALAAFQRAMISMGSAYDRARRGGDPGAMPAAARRGEALFFGERLECYHCHGGLHFTDNIQTALSPYPETAYHNTGLYNLDAAGAYPAGGLGLAEFTGRPEDMGRFRTPSLRNVAVTAPYMHDGSVATLREAIAHYAAGGRTITDGPLAGVGSASPRKSGLLRGFTLSETETTDIVAFLESLTDEGFLADPAFADPWPEDHPARANRRPAVAPHDPTPERDASMKSVLTLAALLLAGPALAHVTFEETESAQNSTAKFTARVGHGCEGEATLKVRIQVPEGLIAVKPMPKAGWTLETVSGAYGQSYELWGSTVTEGVKEIVWTGDLPDAFYDEFVFRGRITDSLPAGETLFVPIVQECATKAERWIEIPAAGQDPDALEFPAPGVKITPAVAGH